MKKKLTDAGFFQSILSRRAALALALALAATAGCERVPPDAAKLRDGVRCEAKGEFGKAEQLYREACALGNGEAYGRLASLILNRETAPLFLNGGEHNEKWLQDARAAVERLSFAALQAESNGHPVPGMKESLAKFEVSIKAVEHRLATERAAAAERQRLAEEQRRAEMARQEAERKAREEQRRAEMARQEEERKAREEEAARKAAEQRKMESADYCIANGLPLTSAAYREISRAMNYYQNTGNGIVDDEENARQHARFRGKRVVVRAKILKIDSKLLGGVKIKIDLYGAGVWLNFPNMAESEGKRFRVGQTITAEGRIGDAMLHELKFHDCVVRNLE